MTLSKLDKFGELLMKYSRDNTIEVWDMMLNLDMKGSTAEKVSTLLSSFSNDQIETVKQLLPLIVDEQLHNFLFMFEDNENLSINLNGTPLESDGFNGELYTEDGWIERFSTARK